MLKKIILFAYCILISLVSKGQTVEEVFLEIKRQNIPHPEIVLAQAIHETGNFTSRLCKVNHNLFGIKYNGRYAKYPNWQASVVDYKEKVSSRYKGGDYYAFLRRIGYASDSQYCNRLKRIKRK
jgi:flagellum-specific peptidoglycan hydrolase FlgJ